MAAVNYTQMRERFSSYTAEVFPEGTTAQVEYDPHMRDIPPPNDAPPAQSNESAMTDLTRQEVDAKLAANKAEVDARLANFDTSIKTGFAELRAEFAALRTEIADGRTDAAKQSHDSMKWIIATVISTVSISVAIIGLFINLSKGDKQPAAQAAPIVITVPGAVAAPVSAPQAPAATAPPRAK